MREAAVVDVGKYYLVPCVRPNRKRSSPDYSATLGWLPVIGPPHDDLEILGFPTRHYHYDWRFVTRAQAILMGKWENSARDLRYSAQAAVEAEDDVAEHRVIRLRCMRRMPIFYPGVTFPIRRLEKAFAGARMKPDCRVCPHRGLPLNGLPVEEDAVTCPGHGLRWNVSTGALVPRT